MNLGKVEHRSLGYSATHFVLKFLHNKIFYDRVIVSGRENIPHDKPVLFAPNHQNALMDALAVLFAQDEPIVFLARSDIFSGKIISKILFWLKILPVFRIRDGKEKLKLNELIFQKTVDIIALKKKIAIFPEAQHIDKRHLRVLKKGIQRVAFQAEESHGFGLDVKVVPVGIYYSNYWNFRSILMVQFGAPISVAEYTEMYKENQQKAMLALGDEMTERIKTLMIHIDDLEKYDVYETLREVCDVPAMLRSGHKKMSAENKFIADKTIIAAAENLQHNNPEVFATLAETAETYRKTLKDCAMEDLYVEKAQKNPNLFLRFLVLLLGFPVFALGFINNALPAFLPKFITNKLKDRQFESSVVFVLGLILFPIFHILQTVLFQVFIGNWRLTFIYLISLPVSGLLAFFYYRYFRKFVFIARFVFSKKTDAFIRLIELRQKIQDILLPEIK